MPVYECSVRTASIAAGATYNIVFTTGPAPAVFLNRNVGFQGTGYIADVYEAPTGVTGGTIQASFPTDTLTSTPAVGVLTAGVTVGGVGTKRAATSFYRGSAGVGNSTIGTFGGSARTRRLKPATTYLLQVTNQDAGAQTVDLYFAWYEGPDPAPTGTI